MATQEEKYQRRRLRNSYITSVISITLVLFLLGIQGLILIHANKLSRHVRENIKITAVLKDNVKQADIARLQKQLDFSHYVKSTTFISKEEAANQLSSELGEEFVDFIGYNPLSASIEIRLNADYANNDSLAVLEQEILQNQEIQEVYYQKDLIQKVNDNLRGISTGLLAISAIILLIAIALINNTIRLSVYSKRLLIKSMQLVGATRWFISKPFVRKGALQGFLGALIATILLIAALVTLQNKFPDLVTIQDIDWFLILFAIIFVIGIALAWVSSFFAVRRFLKMNTDRIHF